MKLNPIPFSQIACGMKTIELRLYDEKRKKIQIGDTLIFTHRENDSQTLTVEVTALHRFESFKKLYETLPLTKCGYSERTLLDANFRDMQQYYDPKEEALYGVVGIEFIKRTELL